MDSAAKLTERDGGEEKNKNSRGQSRGGVSEISRWKLKMDSVPRFSVDGRNERSAEQISEQYLSDVRVLTRFSSSLNESVERSLVGSREIFERRRKGDQHERMIESNE